MKYLSQHADNLVIAESDDLQPQVDQVLIEVKASGINRADLLQLAGHYPPPAGESTIIGLEVAGVVLKAPAHSSLVVGDKVMALLAGGGYAQQVCVNVGSVLKMPSSLSFIEAAAIPEAFITAYQALFEIGLLNQRLAQGPVNVLIHAGASGVGSAAIQLAKVVGATVYTTASSSEKLTALATLGADHLINYHTCDFSQIIKTTSANHGVDIIVDFVGGDYLDHNLDSLAVDGCMINLAMLGGRMGDKFDFAKLLVKRLTVTGSTLRNRTPQYKASLISGFSEQFLPLLQSGAIRPVIDGQYLYQKVALAHQRMQNNSNIGKMILHSFS